MPIGKPLLVRPVAGQFEIVAGARRYRAALLAGLAELPVCVRELGDAEAQEIQAIENLQRADLHPFEEAQGFAALAGGETGKYSPVLWSCPPVDGVGFS